VRKILAITTIRSDYDLMSGVFRLLANDPDIDFRLLVSGAHLSAAYGRSVDLIRGDGFKILLEVESLINGDTLQSRLKTASIMLQGSVDVVAAWQPELILYAGDREDVLLGGMLGAFLGIPTVHFFGGDHEKDGHVDTLLRHATSKLSSFHVVSIEEHRRRLLRMGESSARIFVAGSVALDKFMPQEGVREIDWRRVVPAGRQLDGYAMLIYHPVEEERERAADYFENILVALRNRGIPAMVSFPNSDPGNHSIIERMARYQDEPGFWFYRNLGREEFIGCLRGARFLIGNSSSGILEAASIPLAAINVGLRQRSRYCGQNVLFCGNGKDDISAAIGTVLSPGFQESIAGMTNPYGDGRSSRRAFELIKATDFRPFLHKTEDPLEMQWP